MENFSTMLPEIAGEFHNTSSNFLILNSTKPHQGGSGKIFLHALKAVYLIGIIGNAAAVIILRRGELRVRNRKHLLLLTSLALNDFVALIGMLCAMVVSEAVPGARESPVYCAARVVLRVFGIGSVCIAVTMALERYLALTRPFLYQKQVTYYMIRTTLLISWVLVALLTCAPIAGLGLYYDEEHRTCTRYRNALTTKDFAYAVVYVCFGTLLCVVLVYCNVAVILALYAISAPRPGSAPVVRRVSRSSCRQRSIKDADAAPHHSNAATAEEVAFSRLMATLSVLFSICWMPQMITSSLYLYYGPTGWKKLELFSNLADFMMLVNYVLDPMLYVMWRRSRMSLSYMGRSVTRCFKRNHKTSNESMKTSCCPQDTLLISDSSGAELRPLRSQPAVPTAAMLKLDD